MVFLTLKLDEKGRLHLPKDLREEMGLEGEVLAEKHRQSLEIKPSKKPKDPLQVLLSIRIKTDKSPAEMKKEAQKAMMDSV